MPICQAAKRHTKLEGMGPLLLDVVQLGHVEGVGVLETPLDASAAATVQTPKLSFPNKYRTAACRIAEYANASIRTRSVWKRCMLAAVGL